MPTCNQHNLPLTYMGRRGPKEIWHCPEAYKRIALYHEAPDPQEAWTCRRCHFGFIIEEGLCAICWRYAEKPLP